MESDRLVLSRGPDYPYYFLNGLDLKKYDSVRIDLISTLHEEMSYRPCDYERTTAYQRGTWDGYVRLFRTAKNGVHYFPSGFLTAVEKILQAFGIEYDIDDQTTHWKDGVRFLWCTDKVLRDYQQQTVDLALTEMLEHSGGAIICLPTGSGKSVLACRIIFELAQKTLIVVHTKDLLHQWRDVIHEMFGFYPAIIGDSIKEEPGDITVATVQTMYRIIKASSVAITKNTFNIILFDECHKIPSDTAYAVSMHFSAKYRLGLSATPTREDNAQLRIVAATGNPVDTPSTEEFIDRKILAVPEFRFYRIPFVRVFSNTWHAVRMEGIVKNEARNDAICGAVQNLVVNGHRVYVSVDILAHGKKLLGLVEECAPGAKAVFLQGSDNSKKRAVVFEDFRSGKINVMISTLLREGVDIPEISAYINAAGGKSEVSQIQRVGRALRQNRDGDKIAVIVDFMDGGHRWLSSHSDQRWRTYRKYYGEYCPFPK